MLRPLHVLVGPGASADADGGDDGGDDGKEQQRGLQQYGTGVPARGAVRAMSLELSTLEDMGPTAKGSHARLVPRGPYPATCGIHSVTTKNVPAQLRARLPAGPAR